MCGLDKFHTACKCPQIFFEACCVSVLASVPGLPRSVRVLIVCLPPTHNLNAHGMGEAWNRGYICVVYLLRVKGQTSENGV